MIKLVFVTDKARVIGSSSEEENTKINSMLPRDLGIALGELTDGDNLAGGVNSVDLIKNARKKKFILTRNTHYQPPEGMRDATICNDYLELVDRYKSSIDELIIVGGFTIFRLFTSHANVFEVAETRELIHGDLVFNDWDREELHLISSKDWEGFRTLHYERVLKTDRF